MRQRVVRVAVVAVAVALVFTVPLAITIRSAFLTQGRGVVRAAVDARVVWQGVTLAWLMMAALAASSLLIAILVVRRRARLLREPFEAPSAVPHRGASASHQQRTPRAWFLAQLSPDQGSVGAPHPIGAVMGEAEHRWHDQLDCQDRRLAVKVDPEATTTEVPACLVAQVLDVLIGNALHHGRGDVTLTARQFGETLSVDVVDEGSIAMESAAVFDRGTSGGGGHRASLTLARSMVETRGGRLVVGRRSPATFTLLLPGDTPDLMRPGWLAEQRTSPS